MSRLLAHVHYQIMYNPLAKQTQLHMPQTFENEHNMQVKPTNIEPILDVVMFN